MAAPRQASAKLTGGTKTAELASFLAGFTGGHDREPVTWRNRITLYTAFPKGREMRRVARCASRDDPHQRWLHPSSRL